MDPDRSVTGDLGKLAVKKLGKFVRSALKNAQTASASASPYPHQQQGAPPPPQPQGYPSYPQQPPPPQQPQQHQQTSFQQQPPPPPPPPQHQHQQQQQQQQVPYQQSTAYPTQPPAYPGQPLSSEQQMLAYVMQQSQASEQQSIQIYAQMLQNLPQQMNEAQSQEQQMYAQLLQGLSQQQQQPYGDLFPPSATMNNATEYPFANQQHTQQQPWTASGAQPPLPPPPSNTQSNYSASDVASVSSIPAAAVLPGYQQFQHTANGASGSAVPPVSSTQPHPSDPGSVNGIPAAPAPYGNPQSQPPPTNSTPAAPSASANIGVSAAQLANQFGDLNVSGHVPSPVTTSAPPTGSGAKLCKGWETIINQELLMQVNTRPHSARAKLGDTAVVEARKGLSRVLRPGDEADLELFAQQLKNADAAACEPDFRGIKDKVPCFAMSYVHSNEHVGRFKFSPEQWGNFKAVCEEMYDCGVTKIRVWLDQCLWLRDASQGAWAHTGLMPYVLWPVISLGVKAPGAERTLETYKRMWPFVEEVAGLWSMGVIITSELRGKTADSGSRRWMSFQLRLKCEPEISMEMILLNIYHGAVDDLHTGWQEDVDELKEMARWNVMCKSDDIIVGSDWRSRIATLPPQYLHQIVPSLRLPYKLEYFQSFNMYLDGSRQLQREEPWNGAIEWMSGNEESGVEVDQLYHLTVLSRLTQIQLITDMGEFQILGHDGNRSAIWLLVAMDGRSSDFSRGHVEWTKVIHGKSSCQLHDAIGSGRRMVIENVLREQLSKRVRIVSMESRKGKPIQWT